VVEPELPEQVAKVVKVPVEAIRNFDEAEKGKIDLLKQLLEKVK